MDIQSPTLPFPPTSLFLVGIGGIGMSALAQLLAWQGYRVAGSDRGADEPGKAELYHALQQQGVKLYPQDGSGVKAEKPDALIISSAVEDGNPDLLTMPARPVIHRAGALAQALQRIPAPLIAVAGSCGKTTVTGWLASTLKALGENIMMVNGGYTLNFESDTAPGNFYSDFAPHWLIIEVDESDRSLTTFRPNYGLLLNVGNDHYSQDELRKVFSEFLRNCRQGIACLKELAPLAADCEVKLSHFADAADPAEPALIAPNAYQARPEGIHFTVPELGVVHSSQSGHHSAVNACAVISTLRLLPLSYDNDAIIRAIAAFRGVRQRFEVIGQLPGGTPVVNDYAHNPEKIAAAIATARERYGSPLLFFFQPHGFKPLEFMREALKDALKASLRADDRLLLLPVFYAGGSASFRPSAAEVADELRNAELPVAAVADRQAAEAVIRNSGSRAKAVVVMGARDSSLRPWCQALCRE
ncbi:MAG: Mur ligase domain-containing protein [Lentisphaeria bacterium]|jgi:UDP-N-acetylmuramate--alanine ligase